ncbi:MAG: 3-hydroxyacyl-ACP dehydratase FabZ [Patescibacteria group bacterium]|nr:3-hydroxyacyl-ACP dehydratase FabZ [Patescibacteria group bacterium]
MLQLNSPEIMDILPHCYPFLFVDRVIDGHIATDESWIYGIKNVSIGEPFFQGHFPGEPIMPGVLILEGLAQTAGILLHFVTKEHNLHPKTSIGLFAGCDKIRWREPVRPGDQILYHVTVGKPRRRIAKLSAHATVEDATVATASNILIAFS